MPDYPFQSDGCSGGMTWLWRQITRRDPPWNDCCIEHDRAYWQGGTVEQRRQADRALMAAVVNNGHPIWAFLMWASVRLGGVPWLPLPWRWGYGHRFPRGYVIVELVIVWAVLLAGGLTLATWFTQVPWPAYADRAHQTQTPVINRSLQ